jgi:hypothetical protein
MEVFDRTDLVMDLPDKEQQAGLEKKFEEMFIRIRPEVEKQIKHNM